MTLRLFLVIFTSLTALLPASAWEVVKHESQDYVTVSSLRTFYAFQSARTSDKELILENSKYTLKFIIGRQECLMNKVKFVLSYPVINKAGKVLVSRLDLVKIIDPVLRPKYIRSAKPFRTVIVDPGHGGKDPGAVNSYGTEKYYNLKLAKKLKSLLEARGFRVILTRANDTYLSIEDRVRFANQYNNAVFVSLHFNAGHRKAHGIETFTLSPAGTTSSHRPDQSSETQCLRGNRQDSANIALATAVHGLILSRSGTFDRGIKHARWSVLTGVKHPAILVEGGFMSHSYEAKLIHSETYMSKLAKSISDGILRYRVAITSR